MNEDSERKENSFDNLVLSITQDDSAVEKEDTEEMKAEAGMYSLKKQLYGLSIKKAVFALDGDLSRKTKKLILDRQRVLRLYK